MRGARVQSVVKRIVLYYDARSSMILVVVAVAMSTLGAWTWCVFRVGAEAGRALELLYLERESTGRGGRPRIDALMKTVSTDEDRSIGRALLLDAGDRGRAKGARGHRAPMAGSRQATRRAAARRLAGDAARARPLPLGPQRHFLTRRHWDDKRCSAG
jgi:hypothetical protein